MKIVPEQEFGVEQMRILLFLVVVCVSITGCRVNPRAEREIALLRAEILDLEDQYYALKSRCPGEEPGFTGGDVYYESSFVDGDCENCSNGSVIYEEAPGETHSPIEFETSPEFNAEPILDIREQIEPAESGSTSRLEILPHANDSLSKNVKFRNESAKSARSRSVQGQGQNSIAKVVINRRLSVGQDIDGVTGHEGLALLIQPVDRTGTVQKKAGHLTVRIVERESHAVERQIGFWQFTPKEMESFFVKDEYAQQGILLHLPWDGLVPKSNRLIVFVRYTTADRRKLDASLSVAIDPPPGSYTSDDPLVAGWIQRDDRWQDIEYEFGDADPSFASEETIAGEGEPLFREKAATTERRVSGPRWRPVR